MKSIFVLTVSVVFFLLTSKSRASESLMISQLEFMAGCWAMADGDTIYEERFTKPTNNMMLGVAQYVSSGVTVFYELLPIIQLQDKIVYVPYINGDKSVNFTLSSVNASEAVFENLSHDFPQRIIYRKTSSSRLVARIEGVQNGQPHSEEFPMNRKSCDQ